MEREGFWEEEKGAQGRRAYIMKIHTPLRSYQIRAFTSAPQTHKFAGSCGSLLRLARRERASTFEDVHGRSCFPVFISQSRTPHALKDRQS